MSEYACAGCGRSAFEAGSALKPCTICGRRWCITCAPELCPDCWLTEGAIQSWPHIVLHVAARTVSHLTSEGAWAVIAQAVDKEGNVVDERALTGTARSATRARLTTFAILTALARLPARSRVSVWIDVRSVQRAAVAKYGADSRTVHKDLWAAIARLQAVHAVHWHQLTAPTPDTRRVYAIVDRVLTQAMRTNRWGSDDPEAAVGPGAVPEGEQLR